jgi:prevent-host-death family protein
MLAEIFVLSKMDKSILRAAAMLTYSATDAKQTFAALLEAAAREPVVIRKQKRDVAVVMSMEAYERLTQVNVQAFQRFCDQVGANAAAHGLTEDKLAELLASDD